MSGTGEGGDSGVKKNQPRAVRCCQEGEGEPTWRAWGALAKERTLTAPLKLGGREEKKGKG